MVEEECAELVVDVSDGLSVATVAHHTAEDRKGKVVIPFVKKRASNSTCCRFFVHQRTMHTCKVGEKSTDKISHNTLTSCDHLLFMFMFCSFSVYLSVSFIFYWYIYFSGPK